ncbi:hypothetical protein Bca4012_003773 [Brassica carinata]
MEAIRFSNLSALLILLLLSQSLCVTSKDQTVSCTMCSSCDNPCNPVPTSSPPPPPPTPPRSSGGSGGGSYYYSPPPSNSGGGKYPPPYGGYGDGGQSYYYPPASYGNYPTPPPPNPIVPYFPFYYHVPPPGDSGSDQASMGESHQETQDPSQEREKCSYIQWSPEENKTLIDLLLDVVASGLRDSNGTFSKFTSTENILKLPGNVPVAKKDLYDGANEKLVRDHLFTFEGSFSLEKDKDHGEVVELWLVFQIVNEQRMKGSWKWESVESDSQKLRIMGCGVRFLDVLGDMGGSSYQVEEKTRKVKKANPFEKKKKRKRKKKVNPVPFKDNEKGSEDLSDTDSGEEGDTNQDVDVTKQLDKGVEVTLQSEEEAENTPQENGNGHEGNGN